MPRSNRKGNKKEIKWTIFLAICVFVTIDVGMFFLSKNLAIGNIFNLKNSFSTSNNTMYNQVVLSIRKGKEWGSLKGPVQATPFNGKIYISDAGNSRVLAFDQTGKFLFQLEKNVDKDNKKIKSPYGIAVDYNGDIYVADTEAGKVLIYDDHGRYVGDFSPGNKHITKPAGIHIDLHRIYVTDVGYHKAFVFDKKGKLLFEIGSGYTGNSKNDLYYPNAVNVDKKGNIYVADSMNNRVQKYNSEGKFLKTISNGEGFNLLNPRGIALDSGGNIIVASTLNSSIKAFDNKNHLLFELIHEKDYSIAIPIDVHTDQYDNLYIADKGNNQVLVLNR